MAIHRVHELSRDTDPFAGSPDAAGDDIVGAKFPADIAGVCIAVLVRKARVPGDDEETGNAGEQRYNVLRQSVGQELIGAVLRKVAERQDRTEI